MRGVGPRPKESCSGFYQAMFASRYMSMHDHEHAANAAGSRSAGMLHGEMTRPCLVERAPSATCPQSIGVASVAMGAFSAADGTAVDPLS